MLELLVETKTEYTKYAIDLLTVPVYNGFIQMYNELMQKLSGDVDGEPQILVIFQKYLAYQSENMVIRIDGPHYSPNTIDSGNGNGNGNDFLYSDIGRQIYWPAIDRLDTITGLSTFISPLKCLIIVVEVKPLLFLKSEKTGKLGLYK